MRIAFFLPLLLLISLVGCDTSNTNPGGHTAQEIANAKPKPVAPAAKPAEAIPDPEEKPAQEEKPPEKKDIAREVVEMLKPILSKLLGEKIGDDVLKKAAAAARDDR